MSAPIKRRDFLKQTVYVVPTIMMLGSLNVYAHDNQCDSGHHSNSKGPRGASNLSCHKGNNGYGNGDQDAPGNSLNNNNAENAQKNKLNNVGVDTHGGHEKDLDENGKQGNNGWGNGNQDAPGNSQNNNNAENNSKGFLKVFKH
jgi:hypothetical protein